MKYSGFYKLSIEERLKKIEISDGEKKTITDSGALSMEHADKMIENVIGTIHIPLGIAPNFIINGKEYVAPMAVEEASVVAAAAKAAKQTLPEGFTADADSPVMIGQMLLAGIEPADAVKKIEENREGIMALAKEKMKHLEEYGCGVIEFRPKIIDDMVVINFHVNVGEAQGANMVNSALEGIAPLIEEKTGGTAAMKIISNLATERKARATAVWKKEVVGEQVIEAVLRGIKFAKLDIYRAATHNKGIMNGIDAVAVATGNDWRSVEAGAHAYAAMNGYKPLTDYYKKDGNLVGAIELPLAVATVGPAVNSSPTAKIAMKIAGIKSSGELAMLMACVGLANNFAALSALGTVGIQKGHMKLHARTIASQAGAKGKQVDEVAKILANEKQFDVNYAKKILEGMK
ncbi:hydroxymethylglutaryl-CoA reductase, degradative [Candidatus Micrarchaeota archaeon]|nr:hydroxymethylglutaryl-CoA reductase, degradative [Candidatus Micrarchaeota archaeon]